MQLKSKVDLKNIDTLIHFIFLENDLNDGDPKKNDGINRPKVYIRFKDLNDYEIIKPRANNIKEQIRDFLGHFELYVYLKKTIYYYQNKFTFKNDVPKSNFNKKLSHKLVNEEYKWKQLNGSLYQINKLALKNGFDYKIVIFSIFEDSAENYTKKRERLESFLDTQNIKHINIVPFLRDLRQEHKLGFECDDHWNSNTHQDIAKYLKKRFFNKY